MAEETLKYCPLTLHTDKEPDGDKNKLWPCLRSACGWWHEASDARYSRCALVELSRNMGRISYLLDKGKVRSGGGGRGGDSPARSQADIPF